MKRRYRVFSSLPERVVVNHVPYPIDIVQLPGNRTDTLGYCRYNPPSIEIAQRQSTASLESTVLHEVLHAIAREWDFRLSEVMVLKLERGIYEAFRRNGWRIVIPEPHRTSIEDVEK